MPKFKVTVLTSNCHMEYIADSYTLSDSWLTIIGSKHTAIYSVHAVDHCNIEQIPEHVEVKDISHIKPFSQSSTQPGKKDQKEDQGLDDKTDRYSYKTY